MSDGERPIRMFSAEAPAGLATDRPAAMPASPDLPWITGVTEGRNFATGDVCAIDLGVVTETRIREHYGAKADQVLERIERIRSTSSEAILGFALTAIAYSLTYPPTR